MDKEEVAKKVPSRNTANQFKSTGSPKSNHGEVFLYKNGILVGNKFSSYETKTGRKMRKMLQNNEIYADLFDGCEEFVDVKIIKKDEIYKDATTKKPVGQVIRKAVKVAIPDEVFLNEEGDTFAILVNGKRSIVKMNGNRKLQDLVDHLKQFNAGDIRLAMGGKDVDGNVLVSDIKQSLIVVTF